MTYPYYELAPDKYEAQYCNANGYSVAIVASIGVEGAWAAYVGGAPPESEEDARHFFPEIALPYRK